MGASEMLDAWLDRCTRCGEDVPDSRPYCDGCLRDLERFSEYWDFPDNTPRTA